MAAVLISVMVVLVGAGGFVMFWRTGERNTVRKDDGGNHSTQEIRNDGTLSDEQLAAAIGGSENVIDFDHKALPEQLQCIKCGRIVSKEDFFSTQKCPDCGGGILKAVKD